MTAWNAFDGVGHPGAADRGGALQADLMGAPVFDLSGDDPLVAGVITPAAGPALTVTGGGTVTMGSPTPWVRRLGGQAVTALRLDALSYLVGAAPIDPAVGEDMRGFALTRMTDEGGTGYYLISTRIGAGRGWYVRTRSNAGAQIVFLAQDHLGASSSILQGSVQSGWCLISWDIDRDGDLYLYQNGVRLATDPACPGGTLDGGAVTIGATSAGANRGCRDIARLVVWNGIGLREIGGGDDWHARLAEETLGMLDIHRGYGTTYARTTFRCVYPAGVAGRVQIVGPGTPPIEAATGLGADEEITHVSSRNHGFIAGDGTAILVDRDAGLTVSANPVDDTANLDAVCPDAHGQVIQVQNPTGGALVQRLPNAIGGAPEVSWGSVRCRIAAGAGVPRLGWHTAAGAFTAIANVAVGYARTSGTALPAAATDKLAIEIPAGVSLNIFLYCAGRGLGTRVPDEIPSLTAVGAATTVPQGILTTGYTQAAGAGCVEVDLVPRLWGGAAPAVASVPVMDGALACVGFDGAGNATTADGTNTASCAAVEIDTIEETIRHDHDLARGLHVAQIGVAEDFRPYDGAMSGVLALRGTWRRVRALRAYRNARWWVFV